MLCFRQPQFLFSMLTPPFLLDVCDEFGGFVVAFEKHS
jgi:hypothetical protein